MAALHFPPAEDECWLLGSGLEIAELVQEVCQPSAIISQ